MHGMIQKLMYRPAVAKPHFDFSWMNIHIHRRRIQRQKQNISRMPRVMQHILIRFAQCMGN